MDAKLYERSKQLMLEVDALAGPGKPVCVALTGPDLALLALLRQPGARVHIEHMAIGKAYTCARMGCSTKALHQRLIKEQHLRTRADGADHRNELRLRDLGVRSEYG